MLAAHNPVIPGPLSWVTSPAIALVSITINQLLRMIVDAQSHMALVSRSDHGASGCGSSLINLCHLLIACFDRGDSAQSNIYRYPIPDSIFVAMKMVCRRRRTP